MYKVYSHTRFAEKNISIYSSGKYVVICYNPKNHDYYCSVIIDGEAGEIIHLVASICPSVCEHSNFCFSSYFDKHTNKWTLPNVLSPLLRGR